MHFVIKIANVSADNSGQGLTCGQQLPDKSQEGTKKAVSSVFRRLRADEAVLANGCQCSSFLPFLSFLFCFSLDSYIQLLSSLHVCVTPSIAFKLWGISEAQSEKKMTT